MVGVPEASVEAPPKNARSEQAMLRNGCFPEPYYCKPLSLGEDIKL